jgi:superfamily II DNA helicase RecQ
MSDDDFGLTFEDEEELAAATADLIAGEKRKLDDANDGTSQYKRTKPNEGTTTTTSPNVVLANKILKERFGLNGFQLEQEGAITRLLNGGSAVVVFPTGGGKSLCYQVCIILLDTVALL